MWLSGTSSGSRANVQFLENGDALWWSERSGYGHLYRVSAADNSVSPLTSGFWTVDAVVALDESAADGVGKVWFTAVGREESSVGCDPYYKQLYSVNLDGTGLRLLTEAADRKWMDHALQMMGRARAIMQILGRLLIRVKATRRAQMPGAMEDIFRR